jgi:hypothetical protein
VGGKLSRQDLTVAENVRKASESVIPAQAGQNRRERFWTAEGWPEGQNTGMYSAIQNITGFCSF